MIEFILIVLLAFIFSFIGLIAYGHFLDQDLQNKDEKPKAKPALIIKEQPIWAQWGGGALKFLRRAFMNEKIILLAIVGFLIFVLWGGSDEKQKKQSVSGVKSSISHQDISKKKKAINEVENINQQWKDFVSELEQMKKELSDLDYCEQLKQKMNAVSSLDTREILINQMMKHMSKEWVRRCE